MAVWVKESAFGVSTAEFVARLAIELGARDARQGGLSNWTETPDRWRCPCCARSKPSIVRLDKNGSMFGPIVEHHDHIELTELGFNNPFNDTRRTEIDRPERREFWEKSKAYWEKRNEYTERVRSLIRFPNTWICGDCNNADAAAKAGIGAPSWFSFAPFEIRLFVVPRERQANEIRSDAVREIYDPALKQAETLRSRRIKIIDAFNISLLPDAERKEPQGEPIHVGQAAWNVLKQVNKARKETT